MLNAWKELNVTLGNRVAVSGGGAKLEGLARGVDAEGRLILKLDDGTLRQVAAGDVTIVKEKIQVGDKGTWISYDFVNAVSPCPLVSVTAVFGGHMLLAIDIGNTNVVLGVFEGERLRESWRIGTKASITADEYAMIVKDLFAFSGIDFKQIDGIIISTVVPPLLSIMTEMSRKYFKIEPMVVTSELKTGITLSYENPREIGADRIVNAAAAFRLYGGPLIIIDFGTATTFCAVTANGEYLGGAITPGVKISAEALYQRAAKLPRVELVAAADDHRPGHGQRHAGRHSLRVRRTRGRDRGTDEERAFPRRKGDRHRRTCRARCTRDEKTHIEVRPNLTLEGLRFIL